jgi:hypothetical protein
VQRATVGRGVGIGAIVAAAAAWVSCSATGEPGAAGATATSSGPGGAAAGDGGGGPSGGPGGGDGATSTTAVTAQATQGAGGFDECTGTSAEATSQKQPADVIVVVDTSGSMSEEAAQVQQNLNEFVDVILGSGIDTHVVLIADASVCIPADLGSGLCEGQDTNLPSYLHVLQTVASTDALSLILATYPQWEDVLRPDATKTFLVVSDDNSAMSAADFTQQLLALDPPTFEGFKFTAIVAYSDPLDCFGFSCPQNGNPCCYSEGGIGCQSYAAESGTVYHQLVGQTQGVGGDLCSQQFDPIFAELAEGVIVSSQLSCEYPIPPPPDGETLDPTEVNVRFTPSEGAEPIDIPYVEGGLEACGPAGGWTYDDPANPTTILVCPASCEALQASVGGRVDVVFGCETVVAPPN